MATAVSTETLSAAGLRAIDATARLAVKLDEISVLHPEFAEIGTLTARLVAAQGTFLHLVLHHVETQDMLLARSHDELARRIDEIERVEALLKVMERPWWRRWLG